MECSAGHRLCECCYLRYWTVAAALDLYRKYGYAPRRDEFYCVCCVRDIDEREEDVTDGRQVIRRFRGVPSCEYWSGAFRELRVRCQHCQAEMQLREFIDLHVEMASGTCQAGRLGQWADEMLRRFGQIKTALRVSGAPHEFGHEYLGLKLNPWPRQFLSLYELWGLSYGATRRTWMVHIAGVIGGFLEFRFFPTRTEREPLIDYIVHGM